MEIGIVEIGILGPLEVRADGRTVQITGSRLRALVTRLAIDAPAPVPTTALVDAVWSADPPSDPVNALQSLISRVRRALGEPGLIQQVATGYRLAVDRGAVDASVFSDLVQAGRRELHDGAAQTARDTLAKALSLWRGVPLTDAGDAAYAVAPSVRLVEQRLDAQSDRVEAELRLGRGAEVIADLDALVTANPLRERLAGQLIRALAAANRTADALAAYERLRDCLADELGVDPGAELQALQLAVLRGELPAESAQPTGARRQNNLRSSLTSFIGRDAEVARVSGLLATGRLVTIVGPGGAGKTRLANEVARQWITERRDGVWLVELAPVSDEKAIAQAMLGALGLLDTRAVERRPERQSRNSTDYLFDVLSEADCVLIVDNCEHLIGPVAALVDQLLAACPDLRILTTSREPLGIVGEALCLLPPLGLPPVGVSASDALEYPAVRLLIERAQAVSAGFTIDDNTVDDVTEIVRRLDGLPLAIELAAARLRVMPIGEIAARLSDRFRLLTGGSRTAMPRHRTLRAVVEWSWDLLADDERLLAERLAVFPAGATVESAVAICGDDDLPPADVGDLLLALVDKSLLTMINGPVLRFRMLETIREYGAERLAERGEANAARIAHARYFADVAAAADPVLRTSGQLAAIETLRTERDNIIAAIRFLAESDDPADRSSSLDLVLCMSWYWAMIGADTESAAWLALVLSATEDVEHEGRVWARSALAISSLSFGGVNSDVSWEQVQSQYRELAAELEMASPPQNPALAVLGPMLAFFGGDIELATRMMESILLSADPWLRAAARVGRTSFAENEGELTQMRDDIDAAYTDFAQIGDRWGLSGVLAARGNLRALDGDTAGAVADCEQALRYAKELGSTDDDALIQLRLAGLRLRSGDVAGAKLAAEAVRTDIGNRTHGLERVLFVDGVQLGIMLHEGDLEAAAVAAADIRERLIGRPGDFLHSHAASVTGAITAQAAVLLGDLTTARSDLTIAFSQARETNDMPIVAAVGSSIAGYALAAGKAAESAEILGAAARLRGSEDHCDPVIAVLTSRLRDRLGADYDEIFAGGRELGRTEAIDRLDPALLDQAGSVGP